MRLRDQNCILWILTVGSAVLLTAGCADSETPFRSTETTFTVTVQADPSTSARIDETRVHWNYGAVLTLQSPLDIAEHHEEEDHHGSEVDNDAHEPNRGDSAGYDVSLVPLHPQDVWVWHEHDLMWELEEHGSSHDRYLAVQLGSSAASGRHPHFHGHWDATLPNVDDLTHEEEELAEEHFGGLRQVCTGSGVRISVDGTPYGGSPLATSVQLFEIEGEAGFAYGVDLEIPDGTYDIVFDVDMPTIRLLGEAADHWQMGFRFEFTGAVISSMGADGQGRTVRAGDAGPSARFYVIRDWDEVGHGHPHAMYLENCMGDIDQDLEGGLNSLVARLDCGAAKDIYMGGFLVQPTTVPGMDSIFLGVTLFDPHGHLEGGHESGEFFSLPNSGATLAIVNDVSGAELEVHGEDLVPTYGHEVGFHYGVNVTLPQRGAGEAEDPGDSGGGGHDH